MYAKNFGQGQRWLPGIVAEVTGPVSVMVRLGDRRIIHRHLDHLRARKNDLDILPEPEPELTEDSNQVHLQIFISHCQCQNQ